MLATEIRIKLADAHERNDRILAYARVTFDGELAVRDFRLIRADGGRVVLACPSREVKAHCPACGRAVGLRDNYCWHCGGELPVAVARVKENGRVELYADVAHPVHPQFRAYLEGVVIAAYLEELRQPAAASA